eukprot:Plantae.Rhodophyta-Hildenbrandia_rubra.ctg29635.p1 GENE.Plantae.Rhodophyta-Hildenbrandia_rubra.ctg29635~~Plantae.Rhodophyta-Hildenbrandia_rubra.ctg29635.p1  ORF type:complete len:450 (+),score=67.60 Plantae.Rhodophyta-Hildenbrandia_rubra.ctg29635:74-1423(+)
MAVCRSVIFKLLCSYFCIHLLKQNYLIAQAKPYVTLPNPQQHPGQCGRPHPSSICDPDNLLSSQSATAIDGLINLIHDGTNGYKQGSCGGNQVAVAIVNESGGSGSEAVKAKLLAKRVHDDWGVGAKECQNGVVLVVVVKGRAMYVSAGRGVKDLLSEKAIECMVFARMRESLREGRLGDAVERGVDGIGKSLNGEITCAKGTKTNDGWGNGFIVFVLGIFGLLFGASWIDQRKKRKRYEECKKLLGKLDEDRTRAMQNQYEATSCPICLEDFDREMKTLGTSSSQKSLARNSVQATGGSSLNKDDLRTARVLPCGHSFHKTCISEWIDAAHDTCPVCRRGILDNGQTSNSSSTTSRQDSRSRRGWDLYEAEHYFRLGRVNYYYPDYVTSSMVDRWESRDYCGPYTQDVSFASSNPALRDTAVRSGHSGSSFSFGGGSSSGGGGHGGSW